MPAIVHVLIGLFLAFAMAGSLASAADEPNTTAPSPGGFSATATEWIDAATGHRIVRLSKEPGSLSLYFHQNPYTPQGDKLVIYTPQGLATVNLKTRAVELVAPGVRYGAGSSSNIEVGRKTRTVYYQKDEDGQTVIYATDMDSKATRVVSKLGFTGQFGGVNADETLIIGKRRLPPKGNRRHKPRSNRQRLLLLLQMRRRRVAEAVAAACWNSSPWTSKPGRSALSCP